MTKESPFESWRQSLSDEEQSLLSDYFTDWNRRINLSLTEKKRMETDCQKALLWYRQNHIGLKEALTRLAPENLGGFYTRPPVLWYSPDEAAKIYPLSMKHGQMAVFRLSMYLKAPGVPVLLQMALNFTIQRFPCFATTVKRGFFWHYLDATKRRYFVEPETEPPARPLRIASSGSQSFRILYYQNRISLEMFHILTDAAGGLVFLKTLTAEYLRLCGTDYTPGQGVLDVHQPPVVRETENAFLSANRPGKGSGLTDHAALQLGGRLSYARPCQVVQFQMDASQLHQLAKAHGVTVTGYMLVQMLLACRRATDETNGDFSIQVPVDMRKYFPSPTLRNFSMYCGIRLPAQQVEPGDNLYREVARQLKEKSALEPMMEMVHSSTRLVSSVRYIPLFIKAPVTRFFYGFLGDRVFTNTLSNLGVVHMPKELEAQLKYMDFVLGTSVTNRAGCSMVTLNGVTMFSISKHTEDPSFEEALYRRLTADGVAVQVKGSMLYEA